jgi:hypothetical protein
MYRLLTCILLLTIPLPASAWGRKGHSIVNQAAINAAGPMLPEFMNGSRNGVIYNGYEPDRWREETNSPLNAALAPDHFFNSELWGSVLTIESDRYAFMNRLTDRRIELDRIGYLPYAIVESYGRLRNAFRNWRRARTAEEREGARANAVHYAGVMGHYVGDGAQPLHVTIHYNGWAAGAPNPGNYTRDRRLHNRYEAAFVDAAVQQAAVRARTPRRLTDVFGEIKEHLQVGLAEVQPLYEMEKAGEFNPEQPRSKGAAFIAAQMTRAAAFLGDLWYTAWLESANSIPPER